MKHKKRRERPYKNIIRVFIILSTKKITPKIYIPFKLYKKKKIIQEYRTAK